METRDKELFFMLTNSLMKGSVMHIINVVNDESDIKRSKTPGHGMDLLR